MCDAQLRDTDSLPRPVVLVKAEAAEELMGLVNKNEEAKVHIEIMSSPTVWVSTGAFHSLKEKKNRNSYPKTSDMYLPLMHRSSQNPLH